MDTFAWPLRPQGSSVTRGFVSDPTRDTVAEIGTVIAGKYRVDGVIGEGGMGKVLRATHLELDRVVAIKIIREDLAASQEVATRMLLEARAAASITNEHVVRVMDVGRLPAGAPYIVMEHLLGQTLHGVVEQRGPLPVPQAVDWVLEACEALAEAHAMGIVHRDMKPENLFLANRADGTPTIKVLDFGVSKRLAEAGKPAPMALTNPSTAVGSPHYMAPEQMRALADVDGRADIYALGAVLFELLTGNPPFVADNIPTLCNMVLSLEPPTLLQIRTEIPPDLDAVIQRCLRKNPDDRYYSVSELAVALARHGTPAARGSVERVLRVLGDNPPPASQRNFEVAEPPDARTLAMPSMAGSLTPPITQEASAAPPSRRGLLATIVLVAVFLTAIVAVALVARHKRPSAPPRLERGVTAVAEKARTTEPPSEPIVTPQEPAASVTPATSASEAAPPPLPPPLRVPTPPKKLPPKGSGGADSFGGRK